MLLLCFWFCISMSFEQLRRYDHTQHHHHWLSFLWKIFTLILKILLFLLLLLLLWRLRLGVKSFGKDGNYFSLCLSLSLNIWTNERLDIMQLDWPVLLPLLLGFLVLSTGRTVVLMFYSVLLYKYFWFWIVIGKTEDAVIV